LGSADGVCAGVPLGDPSPGALCPGTFRYGSGSDFAVDALLAAAVALNAEGASSADRKAYRIYEHRLITAVSSDL